MSSSSSPLSRSGSPRYQEQRDLVKHIRNTLEAPFPRITYTPVLTASERRHHLSEPRAELASEHDIHPGDLGADSGAVPLSIEAIDETGGRTLLHALLETGRDYFDSLSNDEDRLAHLPLQKYEYAPPRAGASKYKYEDELNLEKQLDRGLAEPLEDALGILRSGEIWKVARDPHRTASSLVVTHSDIACFVQNERRHEGGVIELKAMVDDHFRVIHAVIRSALYFPTITFKGQTPRYWDSDDGKWQAAPEWLKLVVQIASILSTRLRRNEIEELKNPVIALPVMTGSLLFFATAKIVKFDNVRYLQLAISDIYDMQSLPLRLLLFVISLLHVSVNPLPPPSDYFSERAFKSTITPDSLQLPPAAQEAKARSSSGSSAAGGATENEGERVVEGGRSIRSRGAVEEEGAEEEEEEEEKKEAGQEEERLDNEGGPRPPSGPSSGPGSGGGGSDTSGDGTGAGRASYGERGLAKRRAASQGGGPSLKRGKGAGGADKQTNAALTDGFQVVVTAWGWKTLPETFHPVFVPTGTIDINSSSSLPSSPSAGPFPRSTTASIASDDSRLSQICLDKVLVMAEHYRVFASSAFDIVMKLAYEGEPEADELLNEKKVYEDLVKSSASTSFLVPYLGFYRSTSYPRYALVTAAGQPVKDWHEHADAVIALVARLHACGYVHGDLASRNVVNTSAGLRLIDLGRAQKAGRQMREWEMAELRAVLAEGGSEVHYEW